MINKVDRVITLNDRMGKLTLHSVGTKKAVLRVRLQADGSLETLGRIYGGSWDPSSVTVCERFLDAIKGHLFKREETGYFYIEEQDVFYVNRRYERSKA